MASESVQSNHSVEVSLGVMGDVANGVAVECKVPTPALKSILFESIKLSSSMFWVRDYVLVMFSLFCLYFVSIMPLPNLKIRDQRCGLPICKYFYKLTRLWLCNKILQCLFAFVAHVGIRTVHFFVG